LKPFAIILLLAFAGLLIHAGLHLPARADPAAPAVRALSASGTVVAADYYVRSAYRDAKTPNIVTVVLGDYRSVDTLGEQVVIYTAGMICLLVLRNFRNREDPI
jgi:multicomponent Na+:H+ antiporter subunit B